MRFPVEGIRELFQYNYWARDRQLAACRVLTQEQFVRPLGGVFRRSETHWRIWWMAKSTPGIAGRDFRWRRLSA